MSTYVISRVRLRRVLRALAGDEDEEEEDSKTEKKDVSELIDLAKRIVKFDMEHNAEAEAVDLLMEVQQLSSLTFGVRRA